MVGIKSAHEIELMRKANAIVRDTLELVGKEIKAGMTTAQVDKLVYDYITSCGARPSFLGYDGFPASACVSINEEVVHGIPSPKRFIREGDIVSVDVGSIYMGYNGDAARTFMIGQVSEEKKKLVEVTKQSFFEGIKVLKDGARRHGYARRSLRPQLRDSRKGHEAESGHDDRHRADDKRRNIRRQGAQRRLDGGHARRQTFRPLRKYGGDHAGRLRDTVAVRRKWNIYPKREI